MVATKEYKVIGTRPIRHDGTDKVTGRAQYGADIKLAGMLYARVKRSPHAHAIIKSIDASKALALPGVKAVVTHADFPPPPGGVGVSGEGAPQPWRFQVENFLANKKALYRGHAIAAVAAIDAHIAEDALALIDVEYEVLPPVLDVREAMSDAAPILHDDLRTRDTTPLATNHPDKPSNIAAHTQIKRGDVDKGFAEADVVIEREFTTTMYHQGYIEPHNGTAYWSRDGHLTVWNSSQAHFVFRNQLANVLQIPIQKVTVVPLEIGGGFGGKLYMYMEPLAALLSKKTGKPVKTIMTREEVFEATGPTSGAYVRVKMGIKKDGTITAGEAYMAYEAGAYPGSPVGGGMNGIFAPYNIPNTVVDGYDVVVNKPKTAAYRAPGTPAGEFPGDAVINELAQMIDMDSMDLRIKNAAKDGDERPWGGNWGVIGSLACMEAMKSHPHYQSELQGENRGRGVAMGYWGNAGGETSSSASVNGDGTVNLVLGSIDIGGTRPALAMQLAETLGIAAEDVWPRVVDTDGVGFNLFTAGSRTAFAGGWAAYELGMEIRKRLVERAARIWETAEDQVTYGDDGIIRGPNDSEGKERKMTFKEMAGQLGRTGGTIEVGANVNKTSVGPSFAGHIVDVEVDKDTGKVKILRYTAIQDVGTAIHPSYVEGQIQGGVAQGIGMALTEEYHYGADGRMQNSSYLDYRMPTALDLPMIDTVLVEVPNPGHPYGVRGVGEVPIVPPLGAVQQAVAEATGVRFNDLPITPAIILDALYPDE
ncbi:MAG TPA: xanthine dehydrogenase family protein molybdopterin-binding subunit [Dehalococcoidia bacterium]|nr:xanthine dehydrogenase family protein molybdopterin-binding subunit [Dehalococcoidia bacterium]